MTYAPNTLEEARDYLIAATGLAGNAVGIVGSAAHKRTGTSYHLGKDDLKLWKEPYSVYESSRDRSGLSDGAAALDVGNWPGLQAFSRWLVAECERGAADTRDIREVIYSPDGRTVKRWDRLGKRSSGDSSHLWHTHLSYHRDAERRDKTGLFRRYFEGGASPSLPSSDGVARPTLREGDSGPEVGVLQSNLNEEGDAGLAEDDRFGPNTGDALEEFQRRAGITPDRIYGPVSAEAMRTALEDDMPTADEIAEAVWKHEMTSPLDVDKDMGLHVPVRWGYAVARETRDRVRRMEAGQRAVLAAVEGVDTEAVIAAVNARAAEDADRDAELLAEVQDLASGGATAQEVVDQIAARLAGG